MGATLLTYYTPAHALHAPDRNWERPERAEQLLSAARAAGSEVREPADFGMGPIEAVHSPGLIRLLTTAYERFAQLPEGPRPAVPDTFAVRHLGGRAGRTIWGDLGHYCNDSLTPIGPQTWRAAYWAAQTALSAAEALAAGAPLAYALCRPPGHHAYADLYGGFCYLNNAAIAAHRLAAQGRRVAVLDVDYHHGNGTQAIFYDRPDVLTVSLHADPEDEYPYFCGYADETGADGSNLNIPLPLGAGDGVYLDALDRALASLDAFGPEIVVVSLGLDTLGGDPHGGFRLTLEGMEAMGRRVGAPGRPLLLVQEGGYLLPAIGPALRSFLGGLIGPPS